MIWSFKIIIVIVTIYDNIILCMADYVYPLYDIGQHGGDATSKSYR